jgi:hypothetical protein
MDTQDSPAAAVASALAAAAPLDRKTRLRIALYLARRGGDAYALAALRACGSAEGMNGAELAANEAGSSHDAVADACLRFAALLLDDPRAPSPAQLAALLDAGLRSGEADAVAAQLGPGGLLARLRRAAGAPGATQRCD